MTLSCVTPNLLPSPTSSSSSCVCRTDDHNPKLLSFAGEIAVSPRIFRISSSRVSVPRSRGFAETRRRLSATGTRTLENAQPQTLSTVEIPVTCYQLVGVPNIAEKDEIVKSVMVLKRAEIEEGYTAEAVECRQNLLMDVRDKLLFELEYAGNIKGKIPPKSSLRIPWSWLPGALCLLQEVGEEKLVLDIGRAALQQPDSKPYIHDILLSMALAECAIAKVGFEKKKVSQGFEALARAQCLLRSKSSLGKMALLSQIEESLEELAPACTLELLGMSHSPENAERRRGAIAALHELLRQGLDIESSCRVQDWQCFLGQALNRLMASEIVDLLPWDNLAVVRKNKKSLESQNQRVVVDFSCFYRALTAHIAVGFSSKQTDLINKARTICECLAAAEGIDLKFEDAFCLFLLGQGSESEAVDRLHQLQTSSSTASPDVISKEDIRDASSKSKLLETWLKDAVLVVFLDTRDCSPSLVNFFDKEKKIPWSKQSKGGLQNSPNVNHRSLSTAHISEQSNIEDPLSYMNSGRHLGSAVKPLAPADLQIPLLSGKDNISSNVTNTQTVQLKRSLGVRHKKVWEYWLFLKVVVGRTILVTVLGCITFLTFKPSNKPHMRTHSFKTDTYGEYGIGIQPASMKGSGITRKLLKLLAGVKMPFSNQDAGSLRTSCLTASLSSSMTAVHRRPMAVEEAEALVKQWQAIKAEALGPSHQVDILYEVLDESMLVQWQTLADTAKAKSCFWRFVLLQLSIMHADILSDGTGAEMAEIEAHLEEAAELVDDTQPKNPNYYSTYKIHYVLRRQDDGLWRFCEGNIQKP